jgi:hypothetical protein
VEPSEVGDFERVQASLRSLDPAPSQQARLREPPRGDGGRATGRIAVRVEPPSARFERFEQRDGFFSIDHPTNWQPHQDGRGYGVTIAPPGGVVDTGGGRQAVLSAVIVNHYDPFRTNSDTFERTRYRRRSSLQNATDDLVQQIIRSNPHLRSSPTQPERIDGAAAYSIVLSGRSPVTGEEERVTVFTRSLVDDHVLYALCIAPGRGYDNVARVFSRMMRTLNVNDEAVHRGMSRGPAASNR